METDGIQIIPILDVCLKYKFQLILHWNKWL